MESWSTIQDSISLCRDLSRSPPTPTPDPDGGGGAGGREGDALEGEGEAADASAPISSSSRLSWALRRRKRRQMSSRSGGRSASGLASPPTAPTAVARSSRYTGEVLLAPPSPPGEVGDADADAGLKMTSALPGGRWTRAIPPPSLNLAALRAGEGLRPRIVSPLTSGLSADGDLRRESLENETAITNPILS